MTIPVSFQTENRGGSDRGQGKIWRSGKPATSRACKSSGSIQSFDHSTAPVSTATLKTSPNPAKQGGAITKQPTLKTLFKNGELKLTEYEVDKDTDMELDVDNEDNEQFISFDLNIYPSDYTLKGLSDMWYDDEISVPEFQRNFVWTIKQSSLLIESFLLGLPVPQVFFYVGEDEKRLVIDGLQRVSSIAFFFEGFFGLENARGKRQVFRLTGLDENSPYTKKRYVDLSDEDQRKLRNTVLRVVNIKQLAPSDDDTSMYYVFERLNTGGTPLRPQEIRNCVFSGDIVRELKLLNEIPEWRTLIGRPQPEKHQRDVEIILRVFSFYYRGNRYEKPMKSFLNKAMAENRSAKTKSFEQFKEAFIAVTKELLSQLGEKPFHVSVWPESL